MAEQPEITTISEKGQVVIPQSLRKEMKIAPKTRFLVFGSGDTVVMKRLKLPDVGKEWKQIFEIMDKKELQLSDNEVLAEIQALRKEKRSVKR